jgi:hypothetical protein
VSELYKTKTKTRRQGAPSENFWRDCCSLAYRAYLRQQVVFAASDLHSDETIAFYSAAELRTAHDMFSGEISFIPAFYLSLCDAKGLQCARAFPSTGA